MESYFVGACFTGALHGFMLQWGMLYGVTPYGLILHGSYFLLGHASWGRPSCAISGLLLAFHVAVSHSSNDSCRLTVSSIVRAIIFAQAVALCAERLHACDRVALLSRLGMLSSAQHCQINLVWSVLALCMMQQKDGREGEARKILVRVFCERLAEHGAQHPNTLLELQNIASTFAIQVGHIKKPVSCLKGCFP
ncbi:hypothetical protein DUNSADRAFT_18620 [Dunaliella salina]|uniref:Uncharacterized protein n=1 Tax=Dunaliella salina TaxID=3046 RepID=A0ABQ7FZR2_DUNSA|nr:hypothetical protein DUNSADRAFT_18620 [Dunaliella salina]|eukprot:KAF5827844.1 hypothetical protein DUNSADRAFT_18620 [Dunaliella salina]